MAYFTRFTANPQADLELGYSFVGYCMTVSKEVAFSILADNENASEAEDFDLQSFIEENEEKVGYSPASGMYGIRRSGLCGFGPFSSLEEAQDAVNDPRFQYHTTQYCVIYVGTQTYDQELDGLDDGVTFRPRSIARVFEYNHENQTYKGGL